MLHPWLIVMLSPCTRSWASNTATTDVTSRGSYDPPRDPCSSIGRLRSCSRNTMFCWWQNRAPDCAVLPMQSDKPPLTAARSRLQRLHRRLSSPPAKGTQEPDTTGGRGEKIAKTALSLLARRCPALLSGHLAPTCLDGQFLSFGSRCSPSHDVARFLLCSPFFSIRRIPPLPTEGLSPCSIESSPIIVPAMVSSAHRCTRSREACVQSYLQLLCRLGSPLLDPTSGSAKLSTMDK